MLEVAEGRGVGGRLLLLLLRVGELGCAVAIAADKQSERTRGGQLRRLWRRQ